MRINKIKLEGFKSFYEPYELDFDSIKGLWRISGPVGSGKTTIGEAILFGLFGTISGKNNGDLVSWGKKSAKIELWCKSNGRDIYIKRDISASGSSSIYVEIDNEELIFTNKRDAQNQLESEYFDVSKVTMELLCIISFNNFKSLATLGTADTKKFLDQVLGFYILTQYSDECKKLKSGNVQKMNSVNQDIMRLDAQINKLKEISNIEIIEDNSAELNDLIKTLENKIKSIRLQYEDNNAILLREDTKLREDAAQIKTLGTAKHKEIDLLKNGICPTCGATIDKSSIDIKQQEYQAFINQYNALVEKIKINLEQRNNLKLIYEQSVLPHQEEITKCKEQIIKLKAQAARISVNTEEINQLTLKKDDLLKEYDLYKQTDLKWEQLYSILSIDVRAKILESFIPALNKNIMKYAQELHQPYIIEFDNSFKCSISLCGYNEQIPINSLSTGQLKTVDMMIILGVLGTIIGSSSTNVIFLDELFSNLDVNLRNDMCSVLCRFMKKDDSMFVISHQDLDDRYFNGSLKLNLEQKGQFEKHSSVIITHKIIE